MDSYIKWPRGSNMFCSELKRPTEWAIKLSAKRMENIDIERLLVVGGASASGKSYLFRRLKQGKEPTLAARLGLDNTGDWTFSSMRALQAGGSGAARRMVLHVDVTGSLRDEAYEALQKVIGVSRTVTVVTVWAPPEILVGRFRKKWLKKLLLRLLRGRRIRLRRRYRKMRSLRGLADDAVMYRRWFEVILPTTPDQWFLNTAVSPMDLRLLDQDCLARCGVPDLS